MFSTRVRFFVYGHHHVDNHRCQDASHLVILTPRPSIFDFVLAFGSFSGVEAFCYVVGGTNLLQESYEPSRHRQLITHFNVRSFPAHIIFLLISFQARSSASTLVSVITHADATTYYSQMRTHAVAYLMTSLLATSMRTTAAFAIVDTRASRSAMLSRHFIISHQQCYRQYQGSSARNRFARFRRRRSGLQLALGEAGADTCASQLIAKDCMKRLSRKGKTGTDWETLSTWLSRHRKNRIQSPELQT